MKNFEENLIKKKLLDIIAKAEAEPKTNAKTLLRYGQTALLYGGFLAFPALTLYVNTTAAHFMAGLSLFAMVVMLMCVIASLFTTITDVAKYSEELKQLAAKSLMSRGNHQPMAIMFSVGFVYVLAMLGFPVWATMIGLCLVLIQVLVFKLKAECKSYL